MEQIQGIHFKLRNGDLISHETVSSFLGKYLLFKLNGKTEFGYCSGISIYIEPEHSSIKIVIPHLDTFIEKNIVQFESLELVNVYGLSKSKY